VRSPLLQLLSLHLLYLAVYLGSLLQYLPLVIASVFEAAERFRGEVEMDLVTFEQFDSI